VSETLDPVTGDPSTPDPVNPDDNPHTHVGGDILCATSDFIEETANLADHFAAALRKYAKALDGK
jgi:hypothetical protein